MPIQTFYHVAEATSAGMPVSRRSPISGQLNKRFLAGVTIEGVKAWERGKLIQNAMPQVSLDDREFLISGCTPEEFRAMFPPEEDAG